MILLAWLPRKGSVVHLARWCGPMLYRPLCREVELLRYDSGGLVEAGDRRRLFIDRWAVQGAPEDHHLCRRCVVRARDDAAELTELVGAP